MGAFASRQHAGVEEVDVTSNHAYKYPPRSGNYFGSHFIMGGERFDTPQPESYLFGENSDLNFLGSRPTPFPYPPPQPNEPTKTLKSLVNIRKESLRFVRAPIDYCKPVPEKNDRDVEAGKCSTFNIEFTFDCDVRCAITIYYFCTEEFAPNGVMYLPRDSTMTSETFHYKRGANQQFCQMTHVFDPSKYSEDELLYDVDREVIPIAIHCVAEEGPEELRQSHTTIATAEKITDGTYVLKALKQKLFVDGLCYLLQEIYGIENKNNDKQSGDDETEDNGSECVICMCDVRDTLILPCRHLCLCNSCADSLRYQANNCPICRAPFRALLQIRALQKCANPNLPSINPPDGSCDNIPPGYEAVSLIEALNGPCVPSNRQPPSAMPDLVETPDSEHAIQAAQILNRGVDRTPPMKNKNMDPSAPEYGILMTRGSGGVIEEENKETPKCPLLVTDQKDGGTKTSNNNNSPRITNSKLHNHRATNNIKDTIVKHVNEKIAVEKEETLLDEDSETEKLSPLLQNSPRGGGGDAVTQPNKQRITMIANNLALNMEDVVEPIDDIVDNEHEEESSGGDRTSNVEKTKNYRNSGEERGDESDYYTPEEPPAVAPSSTMGTDDMGPLYTENSNTTAASTGTAPSSSVESTPQRVPSSSGAGGGEGSNPPGTPASLSSSSGRSSGGGGDTSSTYSSSSSGSSGSSTRHLLAVVTNGGGIVGERGAVHI